MAALGRHKVLSVVVALALSLAGLWGVRLWQLRGTVASFGRYWSVPRGAAGGLVYVALGDSTAQGIGASNPERGYVGLVAGRLRAATGRPVQILNFSRSGATVSDVVVEQLPRLAGISPDLVTVAVGGNDVRGYDEGRFRGDVDALLSGLPANAVVADVPWFMHGVPGRRSGEAAEYVAIASQDRRLPVAPLYRSTRTRGWASMVTDFAADMFHPNERGHRVWAGAFWPAIADGDVGRSLHISSP